MAWAVKRYGLANVHPVMFEYGQRHAVELECAKAILSEMHITNGYIIPIEAFKQLGSAALTNPDIDVASDAAGTGNVFAEKHGLPSTFVPGRNMLFLTLAIAYGAQFGAYNLVTGVCQADNAGYPDCRKVFIDAAERALSYALDEPWVQVHAPLLHLDKARTFALAEALGALDLVVNMSHTCYHGDRSVKHDSGYGCGTCPACVERINGYAKYLEQKKGVQQV